MCKHNWIENNLEPLQKLGNISFKNLKCDKCNKKQRVYTSMRINAGKHKPKYANEFAAGLDITANLSSSIIINPGESKEVTTKVKVEIPNGYFGMVVPRSGLGIKHRITLANDVGIIDEDYRGEIRVKLINEGDKPYKVDNGNRIAQMIIVPYIQPKIVYVESLYELTGLDGWYKEKDLKLIKKGKGNYDSNIEIGDSVYYKDKIFQVKNVDDNLSKTERSNNGLGSTGV